MMFYDMQLRPKGRLFILPHVAAVAVPVATQEPSELASPAARLNTFDYRVKCRDNTISEALTSDLLYFNPALRRSASARLAHATSLFIFLRRCQSKLRV